MLCDVYGMALLSHFPVDGATVACRMKRVAVFGNAGGGKSTLARRLAELTGLPLYVVDMMQFRPGGAKVLHDEFLRTTPICCAVTNGSSMALAMRRSPGSGSQPRTR